VFAQTTALRSRTCRRDQMGSRMDRRGGPRYFETGFDAPENKCGFVIARKQ
jgi:hypothetical protein